MGELGIGQNIEKAEQGERADQQPIGMRGVVALFKLQEEHERPSERAQNVIARVDVALGDVGATDGDECQGTDRPEREGDSDPLSGKGPLADGAAEQGEKSDAEERRRARFAEGQRCAQQGQPIVEDGSDPATTQGTDGVAGVETESEQKYSSGGRTD